MKNVEFGFFFTAFVAIIGALIITAANEASFNISQVLLTLALVLITCIYAMRTSDIAKATRAQADASVKIAEEMRKQRRDTVRPVIDVEWEGSSGTEGSRGLAKQAVNRSERGRWGLSCILHNIGLGPAIDIYSSVQLTQDMRHRHDFGTLGKEGKTGPKILSLDEKSDRMFLRACYRDVYGHNFESSREVIVKEGDLQLGPLKMCPVDRGVNND